MKSPVSKIKRYNRMDTTQQYKTMVEQIALKVWSQLNAQEVMEK